MPLTGYRILLVEDDPFIALDVSCAIEQAGGEVIGPVSQVAEAVAVAQTAEFNLAVLDWEIVGGVSQVIAETLTARGTPFFFHTGSVDRVREHWPHHCIVGKPSAPESLLCAAHDISVK
jgi:DNA-binding response OmpR family regulator